MLFGLARNWWVFALRGVLAVLFGVSAFFWPAVAWAAVVGLFAAYALADGVSAASAALVGHAGGRRWWALLLEGLLGVAAGVLTFLWPEATALALLHLIAFWSVATGVFEVVAAFELRHHMEGEWALGLAGVLSVLSGLALVASPGAGALAVAWLIGSYAVAFGAVLLALAFRLRGLWLRHRTA